MLLVGGVGFVVERSGGIWAIALKQPAREERGVSRKGINYIFILSVDYNRKQSVVCFDWEKSLRAEIGFKDDGSKKEEKPCVIEESR
jgi:hypothetical protein